MIGSSRKVAVLGTTFGLVAMLAPAAWSQSNPTADQLIQQLRPTQNSLLHGPTRGIRPVPESQSDAAAVQAAPAAGAARPHLRAHAPGTMQEASTAPEAPSANLYVQFATGSAELTPQAMTTLDELGKALSNGQLASYHFRIEGHTDTVGGKDYNQQLSERRAAAVAAYIEHKFGIDQARLETVGLGETHLLVPTGEQVPEARNRRVQVVNIGA